MSLRIRSSTPPDPLLSSINQKAETILLRGERIESSLKEIPKLCREIKDEMRAMREDAKAVHPRSRETKKECFLVLWCRAICRFFANLCK